MIGVVIWSCAESQRVILWCEDNGPLAYARGAQAYVAQEGAFPEVGDVVAFGVETEALETPGIGGAARHAKAVRVVERGRYPGIDALLRETAAAQDRASAPVPAPVLTVPVAPVPRSVIAPMPGGAGQRRPHLRLAATG